MKRFPFAVVSAGLLCGLMLMTGPSMVVSAAGAESVPEAQAPGDGDKKPKAENIAAPQVADGIYIAEGTQDGGKKKYAAVVGIKKTGDTYVVEWNSGGVIYRGIGIVEGDRLCVSCVMGKQPCIVVYKIGKDKVLTGRWSVTPGVVETEVLTYKQPLNKKEAPDPAGAV